MKVFSRLVFVYVILSMLSYLRFYISASSSLITLTDHTTDVEHSLMNHSSIRIQGSKIQEKGDLCLTSNIQLGSRIACLIKQ